jgi:hypothetical protein
MRTEQQIRELLEVMQTHHSDPMAGELLVLLDAKNTRIQELLESNTALLHRARRNEQSNMDCVARIAKLRAAWDTLSRI